MKLRLLRLFVFALLMGALGLTACATPSGKPTVVISSPPSGSQFQEGQAVAVQSNSTDGQGITKVELVVDGVVVNTDLPPQPQPQFTLVQTWTATSGTHTILVRATNAANVTSNPISISVSVGASVALAGTPSATASPQTTATTAKATLTPLTQPTATMTGTSQPAPSITSTSTPKPAPPNTQTPNIPDWSLVKLGDQGNVVTALQYLLRHYTPSLGVDGIFGTQTRLAVSNFQTGKGLAADGIVGPQTWSALTQGAQIRQGDSGDNVRAAQHLLKTKFSKDVAVDGVFGPKTEAAVKDFQSAHGLVADGIVGPKTWQALVVIQP